MNVAQLQQDDWRRLKAIRLRALRESPDAFGSTEDVEKSMREQNWRERLVSDQEATFIVSVDRRDVGLVVGAPYQGTDAAGLFAMWVAPEARRSRTAVLDPPSFRSRPRLALPIRFCWELAAATKGRPAIWPKRPLAV